MQIKAITMNAAGMSVQRNTQGNNQQAQSAGNMFGPQCKVSISKEGRKLSERQAAHKEEGAQSTQSVRMEKKLLHQQEEDERQKSIRQGYREELKGIEDEISSLNRTTRMKEDKDITIEKKQEVLRAMNSQKQTLMEESEKRARDAQQMAMQAAGYQEEMDENNRDLAMLLKTMKEAEKAEEERESGEVNAESNGSGASGAGRSVSDMIQDSATQFMTSSVMREWNVQEKLAGYGDEGHELLNMSDSITRSVIEEGNNIMAALDDESFSDDAIDRLMEIYRRNKEKGSDDNDGDFEDVENSKMFGLQILRDARETKIQHIADNPLGGMLRTKNSMILSAADAAVNGMADKHLGKASQELADEVQDLIDERNSIDRIRQEREELKEEQEQEAKEEQKEQEEKSDEGILTASDIK